MHSRNTLPIVSKHGKRPNNRERMSKKPEIIPANQSENFMSENS